MARKETYEVAGEVIQFFINLFMPIILLVLGSAMTGGILTIPMFGILTTFFGWLFMIVGVFGLIIVIVDLILDLIRLLK